jgi:hypothetical protein
VGLTVKAYIFFVVVVTEPLYRGTDSGLIVSGGLEYFFRIGVISGVGWGGVEGTCFQELQLVHLRNFVVPCLLVLDI